MIAEVHWATIDALDARTLYEILRVRAEVFVVEQECAFCDPDGRDVEPTTEHAWIEQEGAVVAYLRVLDERDGTRKISRVVSVASARGGRVGERLLLDALGRFGDGPLVLDAQVRLVPWYERHGFTRAGDDFLEDGILHTPMRRP